MFEESEENIGTSFLDGLVISNRYEVIRCLGCGAMGSVHLARDRLLSGNVVALKVLKREIADDQNVRQRFLQEVKLMHRVNHPNVVRTYDVGVDHDLIYFTMEYVTGTALDKFTDGGIDLELFLDISLQICAGLGQIHAADIIHRDLKPANVMLSDGKVKIADFGVARSSRSELTQHKEIIGSTPYIAPEIWTGGKLTKAADFYSLGAIFFELLIGHPPFEHDVPATIMWMHLKKSPEEPKSLRPEIPEWLNAMILRMLAKSPENRPRSAEEIYNYIHKRAKLTGTTSKKESYELERIHYCEISTQIFANLANNVDDEAAVLSTSNSDLFLIASSPKAYNEQPYTSIAIKEYAAHAFTNEGIVTLKSLSNALAAANNILLNKRKENPQVTGISAAILALAITPTEMFLSFAGNCGAFLQGAEGFKRLTDPYQESCSWNLGTSLPTLLDTYRIYYSPGQPLRILLTSPSFMDCLGRKDLEFRLEQEEFETCLTNLFADACKRRPHFSGAMLLIQTSNNGSCSTSIGQLEMSVYSYDPKIRGTEERDYKAFFNEDELDKSFKPLIFDEIEKPKNTLFHDPRESIIFSNLPSTEQILKQQETLSQFSKQRAQKITEEARQEERFLVNNEEKKQNKILALLFVTVAAATFLAIFAATKFFDSKKDNQKLNLQEVAENQESFKSLRHVSNLLNDLSKKSNVSINLKLPVIKIKHPMYAADVFEANAEVKKFQNQVDIETLNLSEILSGIDRIGETAAKFDKKRYELEKQIAELQVELKVAELPNNKQARNNLLAAQREYHLLSNIVKSLSDDIIAQRKRHLFWLNLATNLEDDALLAFAKELALRNWEDSPRSTQAQEYWLEFTSANDTDVSNQSLEKLKNIIAEVIQISLKHESENMLKLLYVLEEARFKREIKQAEISFWRKGMKKNTGLNAADIRVDLNQKLNMLKAIDPNYSHKEMLVYRALQGMDVAS